MAIWYLEFSGVPYFLEDNTIIGLCFASNTISSQRTRVFKTTELCQCLRNSPFHGIIAALDGIAISIRCPTLKDKTELMKYYNRKKCFTPCFQATIQENYKFSFFSAIHSVGTHDSTAFINAKLLNLLHGDELPAWVAVVAEDACLNKYRVLAPYCGRNLTPRQDAYNSYYSLTRAFFEQEFRMLICGFGIFWSAIRFPLHQTTLITIGACKIHNLLIDYSNYSSYEYVPHHEDNHVPRKAVVHFQNRLNTERDIMRARNLARESSLL